VQIDPQDFDVLLADLKDKRQRERKKQEIVQLQKQVKATQEKQVTFQNSINTELRKLQEIYPDLPDNMSSDKIYHVQRKITALSSRMTSLKNKLASGQTIGQTIEEERTLFADILEYCIAQRPERARHTAIYLQGLFNNIHTDSLKRMQEYLSHLSKSCDDTAQSRNTILRLSIEAAIAIDEEKDFFKWRQKNIELMLHIAKYTYWGSRNLKKIFSDSPNKTDKGKMQKELKKFFDTITQMDKVQKVVLELYWYCRIIKARIDGEIPAWEGIRLVQEE